MIGKIDPGSSLVELLRRAMLAEKARRGDVVPPGEADAARPPDRIVGPRDERGTPYPGDFPNDMSHLYKGCF